jgi:hypothetical protein
VLLALLLAAAVSARADDCATARLGIRSRCTSTQGRRAWARCIKSEAHGLDRACRQEALRCDVVGSIVARPGAAICCRAPRGGGPAGRVVRGPGQCQSKGKRIACVAGAAFTSVCGGCTATGACAADANGRWLFTGVESPPARIVTSVVDVSQADTAVVASWDESGAFWPVKGGLNDVGGFTVEVPDVLAGSCTQRSRLVGGGLDDGQGWADGFNGAVGTCTGGTEPVEWHGRLTRLNAVCGNGVVDAGETCDPTVPAPGCAAGGACLPDCRCIVAGLPVCGDGTWSAFEACDASATPSGCVAGESCLACARCAAAP